MSEASFPASPRSARSTLPALIAIATAIGLVVVFALGIASGVRGWDVAILGMAVLTAFVGTLPLLLDAGRPPEKRQLLMIVLAFSYLAFFVVPVFTRYFWADPNVIGTYELRRHHPQDILAAQLVAAVGLLCMLAGFYAPIGRVASRALPKFKREWSAQTAIVVALVMLPIGWSIYLGSQFGLVPMRAGTGFLGILGSSIFFVFSLLTFTYIRYRSAAALALLLILIPPTMAFNFFTGSKRRFLAALFMVALAYTITERRIRMSFAVGGVAILIVLYPVSQFYRVVVLQGYTLTAVQALRDPGRVISRISAFVSTFDVHEYLSYGSEAAGNRLNSLGVLSVVVHDTPSVVPYQGGWTIGYAFLGYIPRVLWPGKPVTTIGQWVTDNYGRMGVKSNTGASWPGEFYFNFGYPGVIFGMFILGIWFRLLEEHFFSPDATIPALVLASAIVFTTARAIGGNLNAPLTGPAFNLVPILTAHILIQILSPPPRHPTLADTHADSRMLQER